MPIPKQAQTPRPVQVQWARTSTLVSYVPANMETPRAKKALERYHQATIDFLVEMLTAWSLVDRNGKPARPTREALARMPDGWLEEAAKAIAADLAEARKEMGIDDPQALA